MEEIRQSDTLASETERLQRGEYFLWLYPRTEYYFRKYVCTGRDKAIEAEIKAAEEPETPVFIGSEGDSRQEEAKKLYKAQFKEANELLRSEGIKALSNSIHSSDINMILPLTTTLKRWALASAKILLTKPFVHAWSDTVEKETLGWETCERRTPMVFGLSLPYSICRDLPKWFESGENRELFKEALSKNAEYLNSFKLSEHGITSRFEQRLSLSKLKLGEGMKRVLCF